MSDEAIRKLMNADIEVEAQGTEFLTFVLGEETYGIDILQVQEIRGWEKVTRVPNSLDYVKGVLNLRGMIIPVCDMRAKFNLEQIPYTAETVVVVIRCGESGEERSMGMIVDAVSDVLLVKDAEITTTPEFGSSVPTENIKGLVTQEDKMVMLLNADSLVIAASDKAESSAA